MLLHLKNVLSKEEVRRARDVLSRAPWTDGRTTSGKQAVLMKNNAQLPEQSEEACTVRELVLYAIERHPLFFSAALPKQISPPMFNRYGGSANTYGNHVDTAVRYLSDGGQVRTDVSCTLFLSEPEEYEGGELVIENNFADQRIKLPAGDMILYPASTVHRVEPVTSGERIASFFWIESMVRSTEQRELLFNMDSALMRIRTLAGETDAAVIALTSTYHNLLRMWADA